jgi:GntR family transcriptional regulator, transcriptional repressor for pyruvate dehydrogenase complex
VNRVSEARAVALLSNYFYFGDLSIDDIYQMRRALEPELAASLAGRLTEEQLARLETAIAQSAPPAAAARDEAGRHAASLRFHAELAEMSENPLLRFVIRFLAEMLSEITIARGLHTATAPELWASGLAYQSRLVAACAPATPRPRAPSAGAHGHRAGTDAASGSNREPPLPARARKTLIQRVNCQQYQARAAT